VVKGLIFDIKRYSIHDGPGIRTTVFFKGCPLACFWCHNPESQASEPELIYRENLCMRCKACLAACMNEAISWDGDRPIVDPGRCERCGACAEACYADARELIGREMTVTEVMSEVERDMPFYEESGGGITLSGGEPLLQQEFARELLEACRARRIHTALDTCGHAPWETIDRIRPVVDLFLYDLKLIDEVRHRRFTGASNELLLKNLQLLSQHEHNIILIVPVIPGVNDDSEEIHRLGAFAASLQGQRGVILRPFHRLGLDKHELLGRLYSHPDIEAPPAERLSEIARILVEYGLRVSVGA
jgi:pyruvate formate lyase activating enzyme